LLTEVIDDKEVNEMANIYTEEWYDQVQKAINGRATTLKEVPKGTWIIAIEIDGDGISPYVQDKAKRRFLVSIQDGTCQWYKEVETIDPDVKLNYRFTGSASVFDEIAAGLKDPIAVVLDGDIKVKGDMRFLLRQAEQVKALLDAYAKDVDTNWPNGKPPYKKTTPS
jgi:putative sterol carrier protein